MCTAIWTVYSTVAVVFVIVYRVGHTTDSPSSPSQLAATLTHQPCPTSAQPVACAEPGSSLSSRGSNVDAAGLQLATLLERLDAGGKWVPGSHVEWLSGNATAADGPAGSEATSRALFAAAVAHQLGIYLLRPPEASEARLASSQARWLQGGWASQTGWRALTGDAVAAQQAANLGSLVLVVLPRAAAEKEPLVAVVQPRSFSNSVKLASLGPYVITPGVGQKPAVALLWDVAGAAGAAGAQYFVFSRPADTRPSSYFTRVWINSQYPDAQYLLDVAPGGRADAVVIFYTGRRITRYLFTSFGINQTGWAFTAWYRPLWNATDPTKDPKATPPSPPLPYHYEFDMPQINFTVFNANSSLIYYKYLHNQSVMTPQPGSGGCASCGFWYCEDDTLAHSFYVASLDEAPAGRLLGKLLTYNSSALVGRRPLVGRYPGDPSLKLYQYGDAVPFEYQGVREGGPAAGDAIRYKGLLTWPAKWGNSSSEEGSAVVAFEGMQSGLQRLRLSYYGRDAWFRKASRYGEGLPTL